MPPPLELSTSSETLQEFRCSCRKLLFKGKLVECIIEIKCRGCHTLMRWDLLQKEVPRPLREAAQ